METKYLSVDCLLDMSSVIEGAVYEVESSDGRGLSYAVGRSGSKCSGRSSRPSREYQSIEETLR